MKKEFAKQVNSTNNISLVGSVVRLGEGSEERIAEKKTNFLILVFRDVLRYNKVESASVSHRFLLLDPASASCYFCPQLIFVKKE